MQRIAGQFDGVDGRRAGSIQSEGTQVQAQGLREDVGLEARHETVLRCDWIGLIQPFVFGVLGEAFGGQAQHPGDGSAARGNALYTGFLQGLPSAIEQPLGKLVQMQ